MSSEALTAAVKAFVQAVADKAQQQGKLFLAAVQEMGKERANQLTASVSAVKEDARAFYGALQDTAKKEIDTFVAVLMDVKDSALVFATSLKDTVLKEAKSIAASGKEELTGGGRKLLSLSPHEHRQHRHRHRHRSRTGKHVLSLALLEEETLLTIQAQVTPECQKVNEDLLKIFMYNAKKVGETIAPVIAAKFKKMKAAKAKADDWLKSASKAAKQAAQDLQSAAEGSSRAAALKAKETADEALKKAKSEVERLASESAKSAKELAKDAKAVTTTAAGEAEDASNSIMAKAGQLVEAPQRVIEWVKRAIAKVRAFLVRFMANLTGEEEKAENFELPLMKEFKTAYEMADGELHGFVSDVESFPVMLLQQFADGRAVDLSTAATDAGLTKEHLEARLVKIKGSVENLAKPLKCLAAAPKTIVTLGVKAGTRLAAIMAQAFTASKTFVGKMAKTVEAQLTALKEKLLGVIKKVAGALSGAESKQLQEKVTGESSQMTDGIVRGVK
jgi:hypothetical protein